MIPLPDFPTDGAGQQQPRPSRLPGADDDHRGPRHHAQRLMDEAVDTITSAPLTGLPEVAQRQADMVTSRLANLRGHTYAAAADLDRITGNDLVPEQGRRRLAAERRQKTAQAIEQAGNESELALTMLTASLVDAAQPRMPEGADPAEARELYRAVMDAAADPGELFAALITGDDAQLAAVAASSFGQTYATGVRRVAPETIKAYREQAALSVPETAEPARRAASEHLRSTVPALTKARALVFQGAAMADVS